EWSVRFPLNWQQTATGSRTDSQYGVGLAGNHAGAGRAVVRSGFVHLTRLRIDVSIVDQTLAAKIPPGRELTCRIEILVIEFAAIIRHSDHDIGAAKIVQDLPGCFATRRGPPVKLRIIEARVQVPLPLIRRIGGYREGVAGHAFVQIV